ncbi:hypothetical protein ARMGADRAFT_454058 [Armillaria gallica]|uniref:Uncharacterized protein n=1 Tax=Armillaria gallica TaxID=47427 RepID=A0A2H3DF89_ARMGA|nr:hypothetical protein ARMGADRAFT_454058 [Armillaria gallica]
MQISRHCLDYKQRTEVQYFVLWASTLWHKLESMKNQLWLQKMQIDSITSFYLHIGLMIGQWASMGLHCLCIFSMDASFG